MYIEAINAVNETHLAEVIEEMKEQGAPVIRAYKYDGMWLALEGSHRLAAAWELGLEPVIEEMYDDDEMTHDMDDCESNKVIDIADYLSSTGGDGERYDLNEFEFEFRDI